MKKIYVLAWIFLAISIVALIVGMSFHVYRVHPENVDNYNLGVNIGISMICIFGLFLIASVSMFVFYNTKKH